MDVQSYKKVDLSNENVMGNLQVVPMDVKVNNADLEGQET